jgi:hypothetical protein
MDTYDITMATFALCADCAPIHQVLPGDLLAWGERETYCGWCCQPRPAAVTVLALADYPPADPDEDYILRRITPQAS